MQIIDTKQAEAKAMELVARGALVVVNHSGGKDSQAQLARIRKMVPANQILVVHAELPGVEWEGTLEHARKTSEGLSFITVRATKTFFEMVDSRQNWPSPQYRQCTSDLKRGPIEKAIRNYIKQNGLSGLIINCMGIRAQESCSRARQIPFRLNERNSKAGREWYDYLPIFDYTIEQVWAEIAAAGQKPHWAYAAGASRLSCMFCIMASKADLRVAAQHNPELFNKVVAKEKEIGKTLFMEKKQPVGLDKYIGVCK